MIYPGFPLLQRVTRRGLQRVNLQRVTFCKLRAENDPCRGKIV